MAKQKELNIPVDGMHCSSCSLLVEKSLGKLEEVESINVDLNTNKAHMVLNDNISPDNGCAAHFFNYNGQKVKG